MAYPDQYPQCNETDNCTIMQTGYGQQDLIAFCPKHKAAPDMYEALREWSAMYEALKEWSALEEVMKECRKCYDMPIGQQYCADHYDALTDLRKKRDAALLKAEGREV